jgi:FMN phosphatase YigB (HAD superfamily)/DNA-binding XRE family transcriptional regulator
MNEVELGHAIQAARKKTGLTQQELCQKTGISYSTLAKIERGAIKSPSVFTVVNIAAVCGLTVEELASGGKSSKAPNHNLKRAKNGIQFIFFDVNGCMVRYFQAAFARIAADFGVSPELVEGIFWQCNDAVCRGEMSLSDFNKHLADRIGASSIDWSKYYLEAVQPIRETQEALIWASEFFRVGLLSNTMPGLIDALLQKGMLPKIKYDAIVDSSKVSTIKPEAQIYELAAKAAGVSPEAILLVDDSRANLMAAEKMGWHTLWFDDFRPTESIDKVKELLEI